MITRLALLRAVAGSDVMVLDEPLEHLDSRARRLLVSSLLAAVRQGLMKQIIVSTYEEALVRRLLRDADVTAIWLGA